MSGVGLARRPRVRTLLRRGGERLAAGAPYRAVLAAVPYALPQRFDAAAARDLAATFELRVAPESSRPPPARFAIRIDGGDCSVAPGAAPDAGAVISIAAGDLIRLGSGAASWPQLLSSGRMVLSGDPFLALRFPTMFGLPASVTIPAR
jgi:hypothetical protein